jgi:arabinose-5-phosphate isomerase
MTENCQVVRPDILAAEAMQIMEEKKINALIVVNTRMHNIAN